MKSHAGTRRLVEAYGSEWAVPDWEWLNHWRRGVVVREGVFKLELRHGSKNGDRLRGGVDL
jgi:hypothetical protein